MKVCLYEKMGLETFVYREHKPQDMKNEIDPENNLFKLLLLLITQMGGLM